MSIEKMYPCGNNVLVLPDTENKTTASGLILTGDTQSSIGTVMSVGPGEYQNGKRMELMVKPNDRVMFAPVDATVSAPRPLEAISCR